MKLDDAARPPDHQSLKYLLMESQLLTGKLERFDTPPNVDAWGTHYVRGMFSNGIQGVQSNAPFISIFPNSLCKEEILSENLKCDTTPSSYETRPRRRGGSHCSEKNAQDYGWEGIHLPDSSRELV